MGTADAMTPALLDDVLAFAWHFGITLYDWQREAFGKACGCSAGSRRRTSSAPPWTWTARRS